MYLRALTLADYRSWQSVQLTLQPGITVFCGRNGVGKTNLVEAVGYLATLGSHRVAGDAPLVRRGAEQALIRAAVVSAGRELVLEVEIGTGRANRVRINRAPQRRPRDILGVLRTVLFAPEDITLVRGDPAGRRGFLDDLLVMRAPRLAGVRTDYERILRQRNALLKSAGPVRRGARSDTGPGRDGRSDTDSRGSGELGTLDVWDEHLADAGAELLAARLHLVAGLRPPVAAAYARLAPSSAPADLVYRWSLPADPAGAGPGPSEPDRLRGELLAALTASRSADLDRGITLVGPHRDELEIRLGPGPAKGFASHGESWSLALALRLASFELLRGDGVDPVLILDDVFAELDTGRRDRLAELIGQAEQVLITAAVVEDVPAGLSGRTIAIDEAGGQLSDTDERDSAGREETTVGSADTDG